MEKFTENLAGGIRRFAMAGVGAVSLTIEKSREAVDHLAARGEAAAVGGQAACDELQKKLNDHLNAFTQRLKDDCESASFEQLVQKCMKLTPEQKTLLIERITAAPEAAEAEADDTPIPEAAETEVCAEAEPCAEDEPAEPCAEAEPCTEAEPAAPAEMPEPADTDENAE